MGFFFSIGLLIGALVVFYVFLGVAAYSQDLSLLINTSVVAVLKDVVGPVSAGFGGAIAGAYSAYFLQQKNEKRKLQEDELSTIHRVTIHLSEKLSELASIKKHNIYDLRGSQLRFLQIPRLPSVAGVQERVDVKVIDVLLSADSVSTIDKVFLADARYRACFENFAMRNQAIDEYRKIFNNSKFRFEDTVNLRQIASVVPPGQLIALCMMTETMLEVLDETIDSLKESIDLLSVAVDSKYKGSGIKSLKMNYSVGAEYLEKLPPPYFKRDSLREYLLRGGRN